MGYVQCPYYSHNPKCAIGSYLNINRRWLNLLWRLNFITAGYSADHLITISERSPWISSFQLLGWMLFYRAVSDGLTHPLAKLHEWGGQMDLWWRMRNSHPPWTFVRTERHVNMVVPIQGWSNWWTLMGPSPVRCHLWTVPGSEWFRLAASIGVRVDAVPPISMASRDEGFWWVWVW